MSVYKPKLALICAASDDYVEKYQRFIHSHERYCAKHDIDYFIERDPLQPGETNKEWYWRKIYCVPKYFDRYDFVGVVDADLFILNRAPNIRIVFDEKNAIYYANGKTGKPNSGFVWIKSNKKGRHYINTIIDYRYTIAHRLKPNTGGENGSVIRYIQQHPKFTKEIDRKWNFTNIRGSKFAYCLHFTKQLRGKLKLKNQTVNDYVKGIWW